jgi:Raf kinase inhibitor-like YbhB/YbcL family protein
MKSSLCVVAAGVWLTLGALRVLAQPAPQKMTVSSPTLREGQPVPAQHTPDGRNDSPALAWTDPPAGTRELAVICEDPDAGNPPPFVHWIVYKIPPSAKGLPAALPIDPAAPMPASIAGAVQGTSGFRRAIYRGPAPPPGKVHHYLFIVYAIDTSIAAKSGQPPPTRAELLDAMRGHIIGKGELMATYERR